RSGQGRLQVLKNLSGLGFEIVLADEFALLVIRHLSGNENHLAGGGDNNVAVTGGRRKSLRLDKFSLSGKLRTTDCDKKYCSDNFHGPWIIKGAGQFFPASRTIASRESISGILICAL